jgi:hypothetical protein
MARVLVGSECLTISTVIAGCPSGPVSELTRICTVRPEVLQARETLLDASQRLFGAVVILADSSMDYET